MIFVHTRSSKGVTLVELLVAVAIAGLLMLGVIAAFQTTQRSAAIGEAREHIYQNARVALDLMAKEIKSAYIDNRNPDLVFVSADGLAGRGSSILEFNPNPPAAGPYTVTSRGLGNAQTPHGIDPRGTAFLSSGSDVFYLYADAGSGLPTYTVLTVKALDATGYPAPGLQPGPPDRLDLTCLTGNLPATDESGNPIPPDQSRLVEVRFIITTETFVDADDNDKDGLIDNADNDPPNDPVNGLTTVGDLIPMNPQYLDEDFHLDPDTGARKIKALNLFHLRRALDISPDKNPFSSYEIPIWDGVAPDPAPSDPYGRYPDRAFGDTSLSPAMGDFLTANKAGNIGSFIYDLQFEFYGRIAIALDANGTPEIWGVGWGYQDVRGEDVGTDGDGELSAASDLGPRAIQAGTVTITTGSKTVDGSGGGVSWPSTANKLNDGIFFVWPSSPPAGYTFDASDPDRDVYSIVASTSTQLTLDRAYAGATNATANYRIIEPTQANGVLETGEDLGADALANDPLDDGGSGIPNNVSDNDGVLAAPELSIGEANGELDSRVMGIWDSRSPDPRNPRKAAELDGVDSDGDAGTLQANSVDDDQDNSIDDSAGIYATPETDSPATTNIDEANDLIDNDSGGTDGIVDDRFYEPAGKPEGVDEPDEANPFDDTLPKAVCITIAVSDPQQTLEPVVLSTTVWLSTAE